MINLIDFCRNKGIGLYIREAVQHYHHNKYWKRRSIVVDASNQAPLIIKLYYLWYIKKTDAYHNCSFGTNLNAGAKFKSPPILPHGPNGIIIGPNCSIGFNCTIFQQVTIMGGGNIGDNVLLGAGAKTLPNIIIGDNVKIGANCIAVENIPNNCTVVLTKPRIIQKT